MGNVLIGTSGYGRYDPGPDWQDRHESKLAAYAAAYPALELNRTFYSLPMERTAGRWRTELGDDHVVAVKAWQAITHRTESPTWRDVDDLTADQRAHFGHLEVHETVLDAWADTTAIAGAIDAAVVLVQTPPSFGRDDPGPGRVRSFFGRIDRGGFDIAWEPRGDWLDDRALVADLCMELDLGFVVDPLRDPLPAGGPFGYFRLHGLTEDRYDYAYDYADDELDALAGSLEVASERFDPVYCFFNNFGKFDDARRLLERMDGTS